MPTESRWIPVSERLPEVNESVFAYNGRTCAIAYFNRLHEHWRLLDDPGYLIDDVTHWQPILIPSPPGSQPEAGQSDSEMLDWLAEHPYTSWGMNYVAGGWKQELRVGGNAGPRFHASNLRDAIRAAMTAAQPEAQSGGEQ